MTGNEKNTMASFLDLTLDYLSGGLRRPYGEYAFTDDTPELLTEPVLLSPEPVVLLTGPANKNEADTVSSEDTASSEDRAKSLEKLACEIASCTRCNLCNTRTNTVPGEGIASPLVMVIGEGPGEEEDMSGRPFVGRAGQLLDRMLDSMGKIGLSRNTNCYIANTLKCRPPGNRNPQQDEISACVPFLVNQIKILRPKIILAAGNTAAKTLLDSTEGITRLRGNFTFFRGTLLMDGDFNIPLLPTFHPSALLRDETLKVPVWEDMKSLRAKLCELDEEYASQMRQFASQMGQDASQVTDNQI